MVLWQPVMSVVVMVLNLSSCCLYFTFHCYERCTKIRAQSEKQCMLIAKDGGKTLVRFSSFSLLAC